MFKIFGIPEIFGLKVQAIFQAQDGYIYVGSQGGLDRFDGYNFKRQIYI